MASEDPAPGHLTRTALVVEFGLGVVALLLAYITGHWPIPGLHFWSGSAPGNLHAVGLGSAAALPMFLVLLVMERTPWGPLLRLRRAVDELLVPLFRHCTIADLALISLAAGIGEELFFRGLMQTAISDAIGTEYQAVIGLLLSSIAFGVCHWVTPTYAALATLIGVYFGWMYLATENLLVPMTAHALYDFVALLYLIRPRGKRAEDRVGLHDDPHRPGSDAE